MSFFFFTQKLLTFVKSNCAKPNLNNTWKLRMTFVVAYLTFVVADTKAVIQK